MKATKSLYETEETGAVLAWLGREYKRSTSWGDRARSIYLEVDCDSEAAREKLAAVIRQHLLEQDGKPEEVECWVDNFSRIGTKTVTPPKIDRRCDRCVDWVFVADHTLLAARVPWDGFDQKNEPIREAFREAKREHKKRQRKREKSGLLLPPEPEPVMGQLYELYESLHFGPVVLAAQ